MSEIEVLFEDSHLIAVNKHLPRTTQVHEPDSLAELIRHSHPLGSRLSLFSVHRLDIPVTGVVVYARTRSAAAAMGRLFSSGEVRKQYWAAVSAPPLDSEGCLEHYVIHDRRKNRAICYDEFRENGRFCRTRYRVFGQSDRYWFLELWPETGRTHQLRAQLGAIGCPIKGDQKYGARRGNRRRLIHLHAYSLSFLHPEGKMKVDICCDPPEDPVWESAVYQYKQISGS